MADHLLLLLLQVVITTCQMMMTLTYQVTDSFINECEDIGKAVRLIIENYSSLNARNFKASRVVKTYISSLRLRNQMFKPFGNRNHRNSRGIDNAFFGIKFVYSQVQALSHHVIKSDGFNDIYTMCYQDRYIGQRSNNSDQLSKGPIA